MLRPSSYHPRASLRASRTRRPLLVELLEDRNLLSNVPAFDLSILRDDPSSFLDSRVLVQLQPGDSDGPTLLSFGDAGSATASALGGGLWQVDLPLGVSVDKAIAAYQDLGDVAYAQPDYVLTANVIPNDSRFGSLWGLHNTGQNAGTADADIDAVEAWDIHRGSAATIVGVIDTGVDFTHQDLAGNMWVNTGEVAGNGVDDDGNGFVDDIHGYDFVNNDGNPMDDNGHGTHVAGTIGAVGNNGIGVTGINWSVRIMALKFLSASGSGSTSAAVRAVDYAVRMGAHITNNSWGGGGYNQALFDAINRARVAGQIFVAAAGNSGSNNDTTPAYPANYNLDNVVSVGASDRNDAVASFSSYGATTVDLFAPGVSILSTTPGNAYSSFSGTSMATPHVAGALALLRDLRRNSGPTYRDLIDTMLQAVDVKSQFQGRSISGGRLNLLAMLGDPPADADGPRVSAAVFSGVEASTLDKVRVTFSEAISSSSLVAADDVRLTGPGGGAIGIIGITPVGNTNTVFDLTFAAQRTTGTYRLELGPDVTDTTNNPMNQDGDNVNGETPDDVFVGTFQLSDSLTFTANPNSAIRDLRTTRSNLAVNVDANIADLNVKVTLRHTYDGDLRITLIPPWGGTGIRLANQRGGSGNDYTGTVFDDEAATSISQGAAPFSGSFRPEAALTAFDNRNVRGTWILRVDDLAVLDTGTLVSWSLVVQQGGTASINDFGLTGGLSGSGSSGLLGAALSLADATSGELFVTPIEERRSLPVQRPLEASSSATVAAPPARVPVESLFGALEEGEALEAETESEEDTGEEE